MKILINKMILALCLCLTASFGLTTTLKAQTNTDKEDDLPLKKKVKNYTNDEDLYFMPGAGFSVYAPSEDTLGVFSGGNIDFLFYSAINQNNRRGPSHVRFYGKLGVLNSSKKNIATMLTYSAGITFSFERTPKRDFLIPYFGVEIGSITQKQISASFQITPIAGLHIVAKPNIFVNLHGGYVYPNTNAEALRGYTGQLTVNFSFW